MLGRTEENDSNLDHSAVLMVQALDAFTRAATLDATEPANESSRTCDVEDKPRDKDSWEDTSGVMLTTLFARLRFAPSAQSRACALGACGLTLLQAADQVMVL